MKKLLFIAFLFCGFNALAQTFSNNWIDYSKTYYKFSVYKDGIYRIPQSVLQTAGMGSVPSEQFQLWKNGEQQPIYVSVNSGTLGSGDYIEFYGKQNDGKPDKKLYRDPDYQLSDKLSLFTDTASYFLTVNPAGGNLRMVASANNVAGNVLPAEPYFMNTRGLYFNNKINPGFARPAGGVYVYSSSFDQGEGWVGWDITPSANFVFKLDSIYAYKTGPAASITYAVAGSAFNGRSVQALVDNTVVSEDPMPYFAYVKKTVNNIPLSIFYSMDYVRLGFKNTSSVSTDRMNVAFVEIRYPSKWNFYNQTDFAFELPASAQGNYLEIVNFKKGNAAPVLYDMTNMKRYEAEITSTPGKIKFVLPPSSEPVRNFRLLSVDPTAINTVSTMQKRNFINYADAANQGNYLIISNPYLYTSSTGENFVEQYRQYRSTSEGGGYNAKIIDINELADQFAYGISKSPMSIKDFIQFAKAKFTAAPKYVFLVGKGVSYDEYILNKGSAYKDRLNLVPTFGYPASDILLSSPYGITTPSIPIGRLSAVSGDEVGNYLEKMKIYEQEQQSSVHTIENKLWMKNVVQIVGGKDSNENSLFRKYMYGYKNILEDTSMGDHVELFSKTSNSAVQLISTKRIEQLFEEGIGLVSYFGHSSANTLEYNLSDPQAYNNPRKYPFFLVSGCTAGNNYVFDTMRLINGRSTISEDFVLSKLRGSIAFMASTHYGIPPYLDDYNSQLYRLMSSSLYGAPVGTQIQKTILNQGGDNGGVDYFTRCDLEEMTLNGDPAIKIHAQPKPDYVVEGDQIKIDPSFISISEQKFSLTAKVFNLGKATGDSINLEIKRTYPNGSTEILSQERILAPYYADSIMITVPVISTTAKGLNKITVTIDANNEVDEMSESNNSFTKEFYIYEDEARPAFPANFAIINDVHQKLFASTANPVSTAKDYLFEIDTTERFNSTLKVSKQVSSSGGIIEFDPGFAYTDSTVYYWRVAVKSDTGSVDTYHWNKSSFIYLASSSHGSNQSDYYQHLYSDTQKIKLNDNRQWQFASLTNIIEGNNGVFPTAAGYASEFNVNVNGARFVESVCGISGIIINVLNPVTLKPWMNTPTGRFGSNPVCGQDRMANFQFNILSADKRKAAWQMLRDSIPDNYLVIVRNISGTDPATNTYAADWEADTATLGSGNSLYHELKSSGFSLLDSFNRPKAFIFMYQKNNEEFVPDFIFSKGISDKIVLQHPFVAPDTLGYITSPTFGPAADWKEFHWRGEEMNPSDSTDEPTVNVIGITNTGQQSVLLTVDKTQQDVDISFIDAKQYPYIKLMMKNLDSVNLSPYQLKYWRLNYTPSPEGALAPGLYYKNKDTLFQGETLNFGIAFKNISPEAFDSMKVKVSIVDSRNVTRVLPLTRFKPLISGDTVVLNIQVDTKDLPGANTLFVDFNPDNDQPEMYHFNNFIYSNFYVNPDLTNPLMDVTFDGIHILNRDIVSSKPHILIKLKDESKYLKLTDTSLIKVQLRSPDGTLKTYNFDNDTLRFTAPVSVDDNTATIDFTPSLPGDDADYELIVSGKDVIGNEAGALNYHVNFRVFNKPMISNLLNYPNPFTTSTAFVFTVTGSEIPQNIRIQILTITGKVVREVTMQELGPLHIGRNVTEFKWDGTDMYGQKLANGVYLYRVLTNLNGKSMDKFTDHGDETDKYFTKGYGKMYLMR